MENVIWFLCLLYISTIIVNFIRLMYELLFGETLVNNINSISYVRLYSPWFRTVLVLVAVMILMPILPFLQAYSLVQSLFGVKD